MYVRIPKNLQNGKETVTFIYNGSFGTWIPAIISVITTLLVLNYIIFKDKFLVHFINIGLNKVKKITKSWWEKEEE